MEVDDRKGITNLISKDLFSEEKAVLVFKTPYFQYDFQQIIEEANSLFYSENIVLSFIKYEEIMKYISINIFELLDDNFFKRLVEFICNCTDESSFLRSVLFFQGFMYKDLNQHRVLLMEKGILMDCFISSFPKFLTYKSPSLIITLFYDLCLLSNNFIKKILSDDFIFNTMSNFLMHSQLASDIVDISTDLLIVFIEKCHVFEHKKKVFELLSTFLVSDEYNISNKKLVCSCSCMVDFVNFKHDICRKMIYKHSLIGEIIEYSFVKCKSNSEKQYRSFIIIKDYCYGGPQYIGELKQYNLPGYIVIALQSTYNSKTKVKLLDLIYSWFINLDADSSLFYYMSKQLAHVDFVKILSGDVIFVKEKAIQVLINLKNIEDADVLSSIFNDTLQKELCSYLDEHFEDLILKILPLFLHIIKIIQDSTSYLLTFIKENFWRITTICNSCYGYDSLQIENLDVIIEQCKILVK